MNLDDAQRKKVAEWIAQGLKLSEIQNKLSDELGVRATYMDVRLLVDDLKLTPKDTDRPKPPVSALNAGSAPASSPASLSPAGKTAPAPPLAPAQPGGGISLTVDQLARAGALVSGKVTFSDGVSAAWYIDQSGRLGLAPQQPGYRPPPADLQQFQMQLDAELNRMGF